MRQWCIARAVDPWSPHTTGLRVWTGTHERRQTLLEVETLLDHRCTDMGIVSTDLVTSPMLPTTLRSGHSSRNPPLSVTPSKSTSRVTDFRLEMHVPPKPKAFCICFCNHALVTKREPIAIDDGSRFFWVLSVMLRDPVFHGGRLQFFVDPTLDRKWCHCAATRWTTRRAQFLFGAPWRGPSLFGRP